ncbi:MAG: DNA sulfur modification protein DndB [Bacillota bacterium]
MMMESVVTVFSQFGNRTFLTQMDFALLKSIYEIDVEIRRKINKERVRYERDWFLEHLENQTFILFAPLILSARGKVIIREDGWDLPIENKLFILDGQEKIVGLEAALQYLKSKKEWAKQERKPRVVKRVEQMIERLNKLPITLQIYLELSLEQEWKFYCDINTQRRTIHAGVKMQYDQRNEFTILTRSVAKKLEHSMEIDHKLARVRDQSSALTSLSIMNKCTLALWEGDLVGKENKMNNRRFSNSKLEKLTEEFYKVWLDLFPTKGYNRQIYVSGLAGIQVAIAYTVFQLTKDGHLSHEDAIQRLLTLKSSCTWKHDDPLFSHLFDNTTGRIKKHHTKGSIQETSRRFIARITEEVQ